MGKATVLALGGKLLEACGESQAFTGLTAASLDSGTGTDTGTASGLDLEGDVENGSGPTDAGFEFNPADAGKALFKSWPERTVDSQQLAEILASWKLRVDGLVERPTTFTFSDILSIPRQDQVTDFHCVEGWSVYDVPWNGLHFSELFKRVIPLSKATYLTTYSVGDAYLESIPLETALQAKTLLAYGIDGNTIPLAHGFPLRLVIPRLFGYKNAKYVYRVELTDRPVDGYWVKIGYPYAGTVPERRLREGKY
jgi:DMSO/TMAO reductase YedYZ molybdopterin-dependent catalytic subunit